MADSTERAGWRWAAVPADVIMSEKLSDRAVRVYAYILWRAGKKQDAFPGIERIATDVHMSRTTVWRALRELIAECWIVRHRRMNTSSITYIFESQEDGRAFARTFQKCNVECFKNETNDVSDLQRITTVSNNDSKKKRDRAQAPRPEWVEIFHTATSRYPSKTTWQTVADELGADFDRERFGAICREWDLRGYNPKNVAGILSVYRDGWREPQPRANGNGATSWSNTQPAGASLPKIRRITA